MIYWSGKYHRNCKLKHRYCFDYTEWKRNGYRCPFCGEKVSIESLEDDE